MSNFKYEGSLIRVVVNAMRIIRGAGKPYELNFSLIEAVEAIAEGSKLNDLPCPSSVLYLESVSKWDSGTPFDQVETNLCDAALRITAARLDGNRLQESAGRKDMRDALREFERLREEQRQAREAELVSIRQRKPRKDC